MRDDLKIYWDTYVLWNHAHVIPTDLTSLKASCSDHPCLHLAYNWIACLEKTVSGGGRNTLADYRRIELQSVQFSLVQSLSHVQLFVTPWTAAHQASLSVTNSRSSLRLMSIESVIWLSAFFTVQLSHSYMTTGRTIVLTRRTFVGDVSAFQYAI